MIKKYSLVLIASLCLFVSSYGQISESFETGMPTGYTNGNINLTSGTWVATRIIRGTTGVNSGLYSCQIRSQTGSQITSPIITSGGLGTVTFYASGSTSSSRVQVNYRINGGAWIPASGSPFNLNSTVTQYTATINDSSNNIEFQFYRTDGTIYIDDVATTTYSTCTDAVDYANIQFPTASPQTITVGDTFNVYAQVYEPTVTEAGGAGTGITAWIGYNTTNDNPNNASWTWIPASFNQQFGNNDEFIAEIGSALPTGTYYYASRFELNSCGNYIYGGTGGIWNNDSVQLIVEPDQVNFCNVDFPKTGAITTGNNFTVYAQAYEPGVTEAAGQGANIEAWIGYNTSGVDYEPWQATGWTWIPATYDSDFGNNDQYAAEIGSSLAAGTYYYASRFRLNGSLFSYGGIQSDNVGNFWSTGTFNNGTLVVNEPPVANVVITEIMYNTAGTDDEWIEICNVSGSIQDISNYIVDVGGSTLFTFPASTTIANGTCITVSLGSNGDGAYNNGNGTLGYCPFSPDYGIGAGTNNTNNLVNASSIIILFAANGTTVADEVTYNDVDDSSTDGNGSSFHVIDATQDNSVTSTNWQAVAYGGSSGLNSLLPNCLPAGVEINVEGNLGTYPDITDGDVTPSGTDNTLFAAQFVGASQSKSYRIQSLLATDVVISSITITGDAADFTITSTTVTQVTYLNPSILEITFSPTFAGTRTAIIHIFNNDSNESEYTFTIQGNGKCVGVIDTISPASGPEGTVVTVSATGIDLSTATASFNTIPVTILNYIIATDELEVTVPTGATDGNLEIVDGFGCTGIIAFNIIDNTIAGCGGGGGTLPSDLFISEVTDSTTGGMSYIEIYNGTGNSVNLNGYSLEIIANGNTSGNTVALNNVSLANDDTYVVAIGVVSSPNYIDPNANTCPVNISGSPVGNGELADQTNTTGGINKKDNEHDVIRLFNSGVRIDEFGVFQDNDWMDSTIITGNRGFDFRRLATASFLPNPNFILANLATDWNVIDWAGAGLTSCSTNDYSHIGLFDFSTGTPPSISAAPLINSSCNNATISITATEGTDPGGLTYQWYYSAPGDPGWTPVPDDPIYDDVTMAILDIIDTSGLDSYQYYCEVREGGVTCSAASDAVQLILPTTTWTNLGWSSAPTLSKIAVIDYPYNTGNSTGGQTSFEACNLIVNPGNTLTVSNSTYVQVTNNVLNYGLINVKTKGSFVQLGDGLSAGTFINSGTGIASVNKTTATFDSRVSEINYTYWSSPINDPSNSGFGEDITAVFPTPIGNRRYYYMAQNFIDSFIETGNNNDNTTSGQDDIDDNGNDWQDASGVMEIGRGYAVTTAGLPPSPNIYADNSTVFSGALNTGDILVNIYKNDTQVGDNNWNFIGNPYPSAIDAQQFLTTNSTVVASNPTAPINGAIFLWSQGSPAIAGNNGNENWNFNQSDYAIINGIMGTAGGNGLAPDPYIPSGQGFFISYEHTGGQIDATGLVKRNQVKFTNSMRTTGNNTQFFGPNLDIDTSDINNLSSITANKIWLNLTSDNGVFSQIGVAYVDNATDSYDGWYFDTPRNLSTGTFATLYSIIDSSDRQFRIQGKSQESLTLSEIIPLGFDNSIEVATLFKFSLAQFEGNFLNQNDVFIKDNLYSKTHNLKTSDYSFTSEVGEFNDRFEIVFTEAALSLGEVKIDSNTLQIIELQNGDVQFKVSSQFEMKSIEIVDLLGRTLYKLEAQGNSQTFSLSNLSQATYLAKVELSNGYVITKKALKRK